jgi:uncharacterized damage-inducible protein DinB
MNADQVKFLADHYAFLLEKELPTTASVLEAVSAGDRNYRPDPKSRSAWDIAVHIAQADNWLVQSAVAGMFHFDAEAAKKTAAEFKDAGQIAAYYRRSLPETLKQLSAASPEALLKPLDFFGVMQGPAVNFVVFAHDHSLHHRGQLAAYLRAMGSRVPNIYGPSADAQPAHT